MRRVTKADLTISPEETRNFLSNAQLALVEQVSDDKIPAIYFAKSDLISIFQDSTFSKTELACLLVSTAYEIFGEKKDVIDPLRGVR